MLNTVFQFEILNHLEHALGRDLIVGLFVISEGRPIHSVRFLDSFVQVVFVELAIHATVSLQVVLVLTDLPIFLPLLVLVQVLLRRLLLPVVSCRKGSLHTSDNR